MCTIFPPNPGHCELEFSCAKRRRNCDRAHERAGVGEPALWLSALHAMLQREGSVVNHKLTCTYRLYTEQDLTGGYRKASEAAQARNTAPALETLAVSALPAQHCNLIGKFQIKPALIARDGQEKPALSDIGRSGPGCRPSRSRMKPAVSASSDYCANVTPATLGWHCNSFTSARGPLRPASRG